MIRFLRQTAWLPLVFLIAPVFVNAEVSRVDITSRRDVAGGRSFGSVGPYERLAGKLYYLIDPANKRNQVIADLEKARRNSDGKVEMSADLVILRPRDLSRGNGIALFDIVNRGGTVALTIFDGPVTNTPEGEVGDGFLLNRGYTIVQVGWEFDARREGAIRVDLPEAAGVSGLVRATFIPSNRNPTTVGDLVGYAPSDPAAPQNTLRVRSKLGAEWVTIPRAKWTLAGNTVTLEGGFEPGQTYELAYLAHDPPIAGLGFAAVRDAAAWVRYASHDVASARYTIAFGSSQTGRWLRDFLYEGFNADERNRQVFDGVMPHLGGGGGVVLNQRWSTPTSLLMETATHFPFSDKKQRDPVTGIEEGLLENVRAAEHQPKIFYTYSDTEYWERSVALTHTTPDGSKDIVPPSNVRLYHFASSSHNIGRFPPAVTNGETQDNPFDYRISMRALMMAMEKWLRDGTAPPPSRYPRLQDGTLVRATDVAFPNLQGVTSPRTGYAGVRGPNRLLSRDGVSTSLPYLVPQVDRDGNAVGGLRLPDVTVPLATYTGWSFRNKGIGGTEQFFPLIGSYVPFATTKTERERNGDPRPSIQERYQSRDQYLKLVEEATAPLVKAGYLLADDVPTVVKRASAHWDLLMQPTTTASSRAER
jgi:Alpha/beta hydrolase domain